ncbi:MAG: hypothetical protein FWC68_05945, partial [Oscillospiraceae bacterium]|nr:hypothetical protein [Oscillospiraceae bacterium]
MKQTNKRKIALIIVVVLAIIFANIAMVFATTRNDLQNRNNEISDEISNIEGALDGIRVELSETMGQIDRLNSQIAGYELQLDDLNAEVGVLETQIEEASGKLAEAEIQFARQEEMFRNRLVALYMAGETTFLDVLLNSNGLTDFLSNFFLISEIANYDTELLDQIERSRTEIQTIKEILEESKERV